MHLRPCMKTSPFLLVCLEALLLQVLGKPCPKGSHFVFSHAHNSSICICDPNARCAGKECITGSNNNLPSFRAHHKGFLPTCKTCSCYFVENASNSVINGKGKPVVDLTSNSRIRFFDHTDSIFNEKCASSLTSLIYNYACRDFSSGSLYKAEEDGPLLSNQSFRAYMKGTCDACYKVCKVRPCSLFTQWAPHSGLIRGMSQNYLQTQEGIVREKLCATNIIGPIPGHAPLDKDVKFHGTYVATFRDPRKRLLSAFNYHRHAYGMPKKDQAKLVHVRTLEEFAETDGIPHCQVKHLLGIKCAQQGKRITQGHALRAIRRYLEWFAFGGITDHYALSVCLFHRMYGGEMHPDEFKNLRPGQEFFEQYEAEGYNILPRDAWRNLLVRYEPYDWLLYVVVFDDFYKKVHSYGLRGPKELTDEYLQIQRFCAVWIEGVTHESDASLEAAASSCLMYQEAE
eukprot:gene3052-5831_t